MLHVQASWDWFHADPTPEEREAMDANRLIAICQEDGDEDAAIVNIVRRIDAPDENVRLLRIEPFIGDIIVVVGWDDRHVDVVEDEGDE